MNCVLRPGSIILCMIRSARPALVAIFAAFFSLMGTSAPASDVKTVFVIALENHNWTQPNNRFTGDAQQIYQNPNAPFINSLVNGSAFAVSGDKTAHLSEDVAFATAYHNVPNVHPSLPNHLWAEAGTSFGVSNDNDPYSPDGSTAQTSSWHLTNLLDLAGISWKSYQEDIDLSLNANGEMTNIPLPSNQWNVPLTSLSGTLAAGYTNAYNGSNQFDYAAKHNPMLFFADTNGGSNFGPGNLLVSHYAPLQQLAADLVSGTGAAYNWITPNQNNDMHTALDAGFQGLTGDAARIRQGDNFLSQIVPMIMASQAWQNNGVIIIWWDESESDGVVGDNEDGMDHTIGEIIISPLAHRNVRGLPYASPVEHNHSSDLRTLQEIFNVGPFLGDAANASDLSDLFKSRTISGPVCTPAGVPLFGGMTRRHCLRH